MSMTGRSIMHIDMNAFFASVEQQSNPELRGKPIAVIGRGRTVVTTASCEARAFGVKTGMNTWQARQACPHIIFVIGNNRKYTHTSPLIVRMMLGQCHQSDRRWTHFRASGNYMNYAPFSTSYRNPPLMTLTPPEKFTIVIEQS